MKLVTKTMKKRKNHAAAEDRFENVGRGSTAGAKSTPVGTSGRPPLLGRNAFVSTHDIVGTLGEPYLGVFDRNDGIVLPGRGRLPLSAEAATDESRR